MKPISITPKLAYTVAEAAALMSLSRSLVYELLHAGKIDSIRIGRARRITETQLKAFLRKNELEC